jgi:hypothetical protein
LRERRVVTSRLAQTLLCCAVADKVFARCSVVIAALSLVQGPSGGRQAVGAQPKAGPSREAMSVRICT